MLFTLISTSILAIASVVAFPVAPKPPVLPRCSTASATMDLPANQTALTIPTDASLAYVALGVGVQNYTCSAAGTFTSIGAVATLFDASCLIGASTFQPAAAAARRPTTTVLGKHYFVVNPITGTGISPRFDFSQDSQKGNPNAFATLAKTGDIAAPSGAKDVDWLELTTIQGSLAKYVFRIDTHLGQPPSSCTAGATTSVPYAAHYYFWA